MKSIAGVALALALGACSSRPQPVATPVFEDMPGGALLDAWTSPSGRIYVVGGADSFVTGSQPSSSCLQGSEVLLEYDGLAWRYLKTRPAAPPDPEFAIATRCPRPIAPDGADESEPQFALRAVYGYGDDDLFVAGTGSIRRIRPDHVEEIDLGLSATERAKIRFYDLRGRAPTDLWAVGTRFDGFPYTSAVAFHFDGSRWQKVGLPAELCGLNTVWISGDGHVWVGGSCGMASFDGRAWTIEQPHSDLRSRDSGYVAVSGDGDRVVALPAGNDGWAAGHTDVLEDGRWRSVAVGGQAIAPLGDGRFALAGRDSVAIGVPGSVVYAPGLGQMTAVTRAQEGFVAVGGVPVVCGDTRDWGISGNLLAVDADVGRDFSTEQSPWFQTAAAPRVLPPRPLSGW